MMMAFFSMRNKNVSKSERNRALLFGSMAPPSAAQLTGILAGQKAVEKTKRENAEATGVQARAILARAEADLTKTADLLADYSAGQPFDPANQDFVLHVVETWGRKHR